VASGVVLEFGTRLRRLAFRIGRIRLGARRPARSMRAVMFEIKLVQKGGWAATTVLQSSRPMWGQRLPGVRR